MLKDKRYHSACHEAAHAVVCLQVNQTFKCIRLREEIRETNYWGNGIVKSLGRMIPTDETIYRNDAWREAWVSVAGIVFEKLLRPHHSYAFMALFGAALNDYKDAVEWQRYSLYNTEDDREVERILFKYTLPPVRRLVIEHWNDIANIGTLLAQRGELSQTEVEAAMLTKREAANAG